MMVRFILSRFSGGEEISIDEIDGSISEEVSFENILIKDLKGLPGGSTINIGRLDARIKSLGLEGISFSIKNGKLNMPGIGLMIFHGDCENNDLNFNIYSSSLDLAMIKELLTSNDSLRDISGNINNIDIYLKGPLSRPNITGGLKLGRLTYNNSFSIVDSQISFDLGLIDVMTGLNMYGGLSIDKGSVSGPKTAVIYIQKSKIFFNGDPKTPSFDLKGASTVGDTKINIGLKGSIENPDLRLSSDPPLPKERLLLRLATNRTWQGTEMSLAKGEFSPDVAKDLIDYFVFSGSGNKITQVLGLKDISLKYDKDTKGVSIKKEILNKTEINYAIEQSKNEKEELTNKQIIGSEYKVTDTVSIGAEKELKQDVTQKDADQARSAETNDKVFLKYKKDF
ncbi:MAG: translocation/assembly module TamB domain-containing protein [Candidatus Omnitrophota bacterium]